jgi:hypothetical protein
VLAVLWLLGWPFTGISEMLIRPFGGFLLSRSGGFAVNAERSSRSTCSAAEDCKAAVLQLTSTALGKP